MAPPRRFARRPFPVFLAVSGTRVFRRVNSSHTLI
jgi:hypothetical protein